MAEREKLRIEVVDDQMAAVLRQKTGAERLSIADALFRFAQGMIRSRLRCEHPDWNERRIDQETARRISHGTV